jgi:hypothetical protein
MDTSVIPSGSRRRHSAREFEHGTEWTRTTQFNFRHIDTLSNGFAFERDDKHEFTKLFLKHAVKCLKNRTNSFGTSAVFILAPECKGFDDESIDTLMVIPMSLPNLIRFPFIRQANPGVEIPPSYTHIDKLMCTKKIKPLYTVRVTKKTKGSSSSGENHSTFLSKTDLLSVLGNVDGFSMVYDDQLDFKNTKQMISSVRKGCQGVRYGCVDCGHVFSSI